MSASKKTRKVEERRFSESKPEVRKLESDEEGSDFECFDKSDGNLLNVDIDNEVAERYKPLPALLPSRSEEDENNNKNRSRTATLSVNMADKNLVEQPKI